MYLKISVILLLVALAGSRVACPNGRVEATFATNMTDVALDGFPSFPNRTRTGRPRAGPLHTHCVGQCDGQKFQAVGRVATMVIYCEASDKGGATNCHLDWTAAACWVSPMHPSCHGNHSK